MEKKFLPTPFLRRTKKQISEWEREHGSEEIASRRREAAIDNREKFDPMHFHGQRQRDCADRLREKYRDVTFHVGGSHIEVQRDEPWSPDYDGDGKTRGKCTGFNARCRMRMIEAGAKLLSSAMPVFLTVTYADEWPEEPAVWKEQLESLHKRMEREFGLVASMWKLEPQKRDAPHFHLMTWGVKFLPWQWLAVAWASVVCGEEARGKFPVIPGKVGAWAFRSWVGKLHVSARMKAMLNSSCRAEAIKSKRGIRAYMGKRYMGKECGVPASWHHPGRMWGMKGRKSMPRAAAVKWRILRGDAFKLRRIMRRHLNRGGMRGHTCGRMVLLSDETAQWARAVLWATGEPFPAMFADGKAVAFSRAAEYGIAA